MFSFALRPLRNFRPHWSGRGFLYFPSWTRKEKVEGFRLVSSFASIHAHTRAEKVWRLCCVAGTVIGCGDVPTGKKALIPSLLKLRKGKQMLNNYRSHYLITNYHKHKKGKCENKLILEYAWEWWRIREGFLDEVTLKLGT